MTDGSYRRGWKIQPRLLLEEGRKLNRMSRPAYAERSEYGDLATSQAASATETEEW